MYSNGIMGLNAPGLGQNDVFPGSNQNASEYATSAQTPVSSSAINAGYDPKTEAYSGQMMANGGIASIRNFQSGGKTSGHFDDSGNWIEAIKETGSWKPDQPVLLQSMDQMLSGDASGKSYNPTEHGYEWNGAGFVHQNGATLSVDQNGVVTQALPSLKDYEFNGKYWNPAGENIAWHPETNQTAYKVDGVEVPIERQATKGIAALTDAEGKPRMQVDQNGQPIFTEPEGITQSKLWMNEVGAPLLASLALGGAAAFGSGAIGAGTTMANAGATGAAATGGVGAGGENVFSGLSTTGSSAGTAGSQLTSAEIAAQQAANAVPSIASNAVPNVANVVPNVASNAVPNAASNGLDLGSNFTWNLPSTPLTPMQKYLLATTATKALSGAVGGGTQAGTQAGTQYTQANNQASYPTTTTTTNTPVIFTPTQNPAFKPITTAFSPYQTAPAYPQIPTYNYTRNAAQGGLMYANGGIADLGGYAAGGKLLKGPGDGMSDSIVANIGGQQPARLADGEFVVPADVVSHLGNGSTDAGAKHLYKMMDNIRRARTGNPKQGKKINANKFLSRN